MKVVKVKFLYMTLFGNSSTGSLLRVPFKHHWKLFTSVFLDPDLLLQSPLKRIQNKSYVIDYLLERGIIIAMRRNKKFFLFFPGFDNFLWPLCGTKGLNFGTIDFYHFPLHVEVWVKAVSSHTSRSSLESVRKSPLLRIPSHANLISSLIRGFSRSFI